MQLENPRRFASRVSNHSTRYSATDQVTVMIMCMYHSMCWWNAPRGSDAAMGWSVICVCGIYDHTHLLFADISHLYSNVRLGELFIFKSMFLLLEVYSKSCLEMILTNFSEHLNFEQFAD